MSTRIRSEISRSKLYHLPKHRQLELVHFCLQYPMWRQMLSAIDGYSSGSAVHKAPDKDGYAGSLVEDAAEERARLSDKMAMVEVSAKAAADDLAAYLLRGVTEGVGYDALGIPCCKEVYYRMYRHFFWLLDKVRG